MISVQVIQKVKINNPLDFNRSVHITVLVLLGLDQRNHCSKNVILSLGGCIFSGRSVPKIYTLTCKKAKHHPPFGPEGGIAAVVLATWACSERGEGVVFLPPLKSTCCLLMMFSWDPRGPRTCLWRWVGREEALWGSWERIGALVDNWPLDVPRTAGVLLN